LWINALLSDVVIIFIKLAQMTRAATLNYPGGRANTRKEQCRACRLLGSICGWEENRV